VAPPSVGSPGPPGAGSDDPVRERVAPRGRLEGDAASLRPRGVVAQRELRRPDEHPGERRRRGARRDRRRDRRPAAPERLVRLVDALRTHAEEQIGTAALERAEVRGGAGEAVVDVRQKTPASTAFAPLASVASGGSSVDV
jgi:hypothetical protein